MFNPPDDPAQDSFVWFASLVYIALRTACSSPGTGNSIALIVLGALHASEQLGFCYSRVIATVELGQILL